MQYISRATLERAMEYADFAGTFPISEAHEGFSIPFPDDACAFRFFAGLGRMGGADTTDLTGDDAVSLAASARRSGSGAGGVRIFFTGWNLED